MAKQSDIDERLVDSAILWLDDLNDCNYIRDPIVQLRVKFDVNAYVAAYLWNAWIEANQ